MPIQLHGSDPVFRGTRPAAGVDELVEWTRAQLGIGPERPWRVIHSRQKMTKTLFEVDENGRRLIGKVSQSERARQTFDILSELWRAGMRPPSKCIVTEPLAWLPDRNLLLQAKAAGVQLIDLVQSRKQGAPAAVEAAAQWLHALHGLQLNPPDPSPPDVERCRSELMHGLPEAAARIDKIAARLSEELSADTQERKVPSHGDYHPLNVFIDEDGTVTAIDLDTFAAREPASDVSYFLAQLAIMGFHVLGGFEATAEMRGVFRRAAPPAGDDRIDAGIRWAFLRSLHYDVCILKLRERGHVTPFLHVAENGL
jgi:hypothetical protein